ncbi:MAG: DUF2089 domain-containing protein [Firmicutes bacterium]|nr:DUF2089 domain-containing protein [Bacillota bacterium]
MDYTTPGTCPICGHELRVNRLSCSFCATELAGNFSICKFCRLPAEQKKFIEIFIKCRGSIKEVEKELGISYPTVRNRLDSVIQALGYRVSPAENSGHNSANAAEILAALERGDISVAEAAEQLKGKPRQ